MGLLERFAPPPGAPGAVRAGASCWRHAADALSQLADRTGSSWALLGAGWRGPAHDAFAGVAGPFLAAMGPAVQAARSAAGTLDALADGIEAAQAEYRQRMLAVGLTAAAGVLLTPLTLTGSDEAAAVLIAGELATATEIAATATGTALAALSALAEQAAALAARWLVFAGAAAGADVASSLVVHGLDDPLGHLALADDAEFALVGAVAVPLSGVFGGVVSGAGAAAGGRLAGGVRGLAVSAGSLASADALVRAALGQGIDPGELAMAALPLPLGGKPRAVPLGFAGEAEFTAFTGDLLGGLRAAGYRDAVPVFQGSAVTGVKYTTGQPFDVGRRSDFDIALADQALFAKARSLGVKLRAGGSRTGPLSDRDLIALGLDDVAARLSARAGREVHFMVYRDLQGAVSRSGGMVVR